MTPRPPDTAEPGTPAAAASVGTFNLLAVGPVPPPVNGLSKAFTFVVAGLPRHGWRIRVVDTADRTTPRVGSAFSLARLGAISSVLVSAAVAVPAVDLVYVTIAQSRWGFAKDFLIIRWALLFGRSVVVHMHGGNFGGFYASLTAAERWVVKATLDRLGGIIVLTAGLKADFSMTHDWQTRTVPISNTCDNAAGMPRLPRDGELRFLYLSSLLVSKGYREALMAVDKLARQRPELRVRLDLAGALLPERDFPDAAAQLDDLREMMAALPGNAVATYHGVVQGEVKEAMLSEADIFVLPTGYINEGQPIAVIEALTAGLPVIASDWRGIRETIPAAMHQLLMPPRDVDALVQRMMLFTDTPVLLESMSRLALTHAENFRPEQHLRLIDQALRGAMHANGGEAGRAEVRAHG